MNITKELSNLSYTNKDFNSIYSELLEYTKKLSDKWDPSSSDESDPGVVLLKLAALIGDKDSYNIDKNILELMPASVSQLPAARQLFDQCGYTMKYYRAASGNINLLIRENMGDNIDDNYDYTYTIPRFTMFTDADKSIVYTLTENITIPVRTEMPLPVLEGTLVKYTVNNDSLITPQNLDSNNRLYFTESNVAENGIFINNVGDSTKIWTRVDNLQTQPKNTRCYKFGLTIDGAVCYIEFPEDISFLMGEGLNINYILTSGASGNVSAGKLKEFYVDTKFTRIVDRLEAVPVNATTEQVYIRNVLPITGGADPETIEQAYKNYKKVRDTFDTLVSLKDYSDYIVTYEHASNGYVCDRTNDIQHTYKLVTNTGNSTYTKTIVEDSKEKLYIRNDDGTYTETEQTTHSMNAFDLCVYALQYCPSVTKTDEFKTSFKIFDMNKYQEERNFILASDVKSLQHNYKDFEANRILMIKNKYSVTASVIPRQPLSTTEKMHVLSNIETALCKYLNSKEIAFGEPISAEILQTAILTADERIKTLIDFVSPTYTTYAVYMTLTGEFNEIRIDVDSDNAGYVVADVSLSNFDPENNELYIRDLTGNFMRVDSDATFEYDTVYYTFDNDLENLWNYFRTEIFAKNVLAGVTPLYTDANTYEFSVKQSNLKEYGPVKRVSTNLSLTFTKQEDTNKWECPPLRKQESVLLTSPSFVEENNFSSYVKVIYNLPNCNVDKIASDSKYQLTGDDYIIFFWKDSDVAEDYTYVKYSGKNTSKAKFISPSGFALKKDQDLTSTTEFASSMTADAQATIKTHFANLKDGKHTTSSTIYVGYKNYTETEFVNKCLKSDTKDQVLTGMHIVKTFNLNEIHINNNENGCSHIYWILNNVINGKSVLFDKDIKEYTLQSGEYFLYTNDEKTALYLLGEGTIIKRGNQTTEWSVDAIDYEDLLSEGIDMLENKWFTIKKIPISTTPDPTVAGVWAQEQKLILIGPQNKITLEYHGEGSVSEVQLNSASTQSLKDFTISYTDSEENTTVIENIESSYVYWSGRALLSVDTSAGNAQLLEKGQSVTVMLNDTSQDIIGKIDAYGNYVPRIVQSSDSISGVGNTPINIDRSHKNNSVGILAYDVSSDGDDASHMLQSTEIIELTPNMVNTITVTFDVLPGNYLLQLSPSGSLQTLELVSNTNNVSVVKLGNTYTYSFSVKTLTTVNFTITAETKVKNNIITIPPLFRYTKDELKKFKDDKFEQRLLNRIYNLDPRGEFSYIHKPHNPIVNPLYSAEFMKKAHFYNPYTICEWDTQMTSGKTDNVKIHDVVR